MQYGFRKNHSTEMATCYVFEKIKTNIDSAVFWTWAKHLILLIIVFCSQKCPILICLWENIKWVKSYLTGRKQWTRVGDSTSSSIGCSVGVPQGSILGPLLFSLYVNYLPLLCPEVDTQMYADDTVILAHGKNRCEMVAKLTAAMAKFLIGSQSTAWP